MKKSKLVSVIAGSTAAVAIGMSGVSAAYAQDSSKVNDTFTSILADKLGTSKEEIKTAVEQTRITLHNEKETNVDNAILQALEEGKLTQRQVDIINELEDIRDENMENEGMHRRKPNKNGIVNVLRERGLKVSKDELSKLKSTLRQLKISILGNMMHM